MEENPKERFEKIKESINKIEKLKPIKEYEMYSFNDIMKTLCENREKINEIISKISE